MKIKFYLGKLSSLTSHLSLQKAFTLIELLIVIAILGIMAGGVVVAINPLGKLNSANLAKVETFDASVQNSLSINLVGEWTFDGNANDTSGYGNHGTLVGPPTLTTDRNGQTNKAYSFDGTNYNRITTNAATSSVLNITGSGLTLTVWFKTANVSAIHPQHLASNFMYNGPSNQGGYQLITCATKKIGLNFSTSVSGHTSTCATSGAALDDDKWHLGVLTYDGSRLKLYVDTVVVSDQAVTGTINSSTKNFWIGMREQYTTPQFNGTIDDVRIYKSALLSFQIKQLYAQGLVKYPLTNTLFSALLNENL